MFEPSEDLQAATEAMAKNWIPTERPFMTIVAHCLVSIANSLERLADYEREKLL